MKLTPGGGGIQSLQQQQGKGLYLLMSLSGLVLLVACANVANLLLARGSMRKVEISIKLALGARRSQLIGQMLVESILLSMMGGVAGLALAYSGSRMILALAFPDVKQLPISASPSPAVLGFAFLLSLVTGAVFGVLPAWIGSHAEPADALRGHNRSTRDRASLPQRSLILFQTVLSMVLLLGAGLFARSLGNLEHQDYGFQTQNRYVLQLDPSGAGVNAEQLPALYRSLEDHFSALPGVRNVGLALSSPQDGNGWNTSINIAGRSASSTDNAMVAFDRVGSHYFDALGQPILQGRGFRDGDAGTSQNVAVVNQAFVKLFFPHDNPIGRHFGEYGPKFADSIEIVGVVGNARYDDPRENPRPMFFRPLTQIVPNADANVRGYELRSMYVSSVMLQFDRKPENLEVLVRNTLKQVNPNLVVVDLASLPEQIRGSVNQDRLMARLASLFGVLALMLAAVGLYGVTAYQVTRRTSEIGLRMALGADRGDVLRMVMRGAIRQIVVGLAIGIPAALACSRALASMLYGVQPYDPLSVAVAVGVLLVAACVAGWLPARKAARTEPSVALRIQ